MNFTFLGTGTSGGIPLIGCDCPTCKSTDSKDIRTRCCSTVEKNGVRILLDSSTDLRQQLLRESIRRVDAVFYTHTHSDHISGLDDLRPVSFIQRFPIELFIKTDQVEELKTRFDYIFNGPVQQGGGVVQVTPKPFNLEDTIEFKGFTIKPLKVHHGVLSISGFLIDHKIAYITDANHLPKETIELIRGVDILILNALRFKPHTTHFTLDESIDIVKQVTPKKSYFIHMSHDINHKRDSKLLPPNTEFAYDGLKFSL